MRTKVCFFAFILLISMAGCGVNPTVSSPTLPPPTVPTTAVALPPATGAPSAVPTADASFPAWLGQTWDLKTYRLRLQIHVVVKRLDGHTDEGVFLDVAGAFHNRDVEYQQLGSVSAPNVPRGAGGTLRLIKATGRTYVRGPSPLLGLDSPTWYQIDPSVLSAAGPIYDVYQILPQMFGPVNLRNLTPAGTESLDGQRCDLIQGDENAAPQMIQLLADLPKLKADQPVRQQLQDQGGTLISSNTTLVICPDGYLHRVEARYVYLPPHASDCEVALTLTFDLMDINGAVDITPPSDAITPRPKATAAQSTNELSATETRAVAELVRRGQVQTDAGDYHAAVATITEAITRDPRAAGAYFARGEAYVLLEQYAHAIDDYSHAITLAPDFADAFRRRGFARRKSDDIHGAIEDYTEAIRQNADDKAAYLGRGLAYGDGLDDWQRAANDYTRALAIDPDYASAYHNRGVARRNLGDFVGSVADYTEEIKREPEDPSAYRGRGLSYLRLQKYQNAIDDLDIAIRLDPTDASALCNRGAAYLGLHDYEAAVRDSSESIQLAPNDTCAYVNRGEARAALGDTSGALDDYQHALDLARQCTCQDDTEKLIRERIQKLQT